MSLFRRAKDTEIDDEPLSAVLRVHDVTSGTSYEYERKPDEVAEAARGEWTRPRVAPEPEFVTITMPWSTEPPRVPGLYWWRPADMARYESWLPLLAVVLDYGGRLAVRTRRGDTSTFVSVQGLWRQWAGPIPLAEGMQLEQMEIAT